MSVHAWEALLPSASMVCARSVAFPPNWTGQFKSILPGCDLMLAPGKQGWGQERSWLRGLGAQALCHPWGSFMLRRTAEPQGLGSVTSLPVSILREN